MPSVIDSTPYTNDNSISSTVSWGNALRNTSHCLSFVLGSNIRDFASNMSSDRVGGEVNTFSAVGTGAKLADGVAPGGSVAILASAGDGVVPDGTVVTLAPAGGCVAPGGNAAILASAGEGVAIDGIISKLTSSSDGTLLSKVPKLGVVPGGNVPVLPFAGGGVDPGGNDAPNVGVLVNTGTPVPVGIDGVPVPSPFAGGGVVPDGMDTFNVGLVVDPGRPVLLDIDGANVSDPSPLVGNLVAVEGAIREGADVPPLVGDMDAPDVGLVVDPETPVLLDIDGADVPVPSPPVGDVVAAVDAIGEGADDGGMDPPDVGLVVDPGMPVLLDIDGANVPVPSPPVGDVVAAEVDIVVGTGDPPPSGITIELAQVTPIGSPTPSNASTYASRYSLVLNGSFSMSSIVHDASPLKRYSNSTVKVISMLVPEHSPSLLLSTSN